MKVYRVLGKRGRITIPYEMRVRFHFAPDDLLSFEQRSDGSVIIRKEHSGGEQVDGRSGEDKAQVFSLFEFLDALSQEERRTICVHLMAQNARNRYGGFHA